MERWARTYFAEAKLFAEGSRKPSCAICQKLKDALGCGRVLRKGVLRHNDLHRNIEDLNPKSLYRTIVLNP